MGDVKVVATNKTAYHEYFIEDKYEAGIVLSGTEIKSVRQGKVNLKDSYVSIIGNEIFLVGASISHYEKGSYYNQPEKRDRKLLLHKAEIRKLRADVERKGYTIVATRMYFVKSLLKVEIALAKGKELHDKRQALAAKQQKRDIDRELASKNLK